MFKKCQLFVLIVSLNRNWINLRDAESGEIIWESTEDVSKSDKELEGSKNNGDGNQITDQFFCL